MLLLHFDIRYQESRNEDLQGLVFEDIGETGSCASVS